MSICRGVCCSRICWMSRACRARHGWRWSRSTRSGSCWGRMWWGGSAAWGSRCTGSSRFWMPCRRRWRTRWPGRIFWRCCPHRQYKQKRPEPVGAFSLTAAASYLPSQRLSTRVALVPPKPKLLLMTVSILAFSSVLRRIGKSATSGSSSSMLAEPAMKLFSIISRQ